MRKENALSVAYVLIPDVNDGCEHAQQLAEWLKPLRAKGSRKNMSSQGFVVIIWLF